MLNKEQLEEKRWSAIAKRRTPEEWIKAINSITNRNVRIQVACIVFWDRDIDFPQLDKYLKAWKFDQNAKTEDVRTALMKIGYPPRIATRRGTVRNERDIEKKYRGGRTTEVLIEEERQ